MTKIILILGVLMSSFALSVEEAIISNNNYYAGCDCGGSSHHKHNMNKKKGKIRKPR